MLNEFFSVQKKRFVLVFQQISTLRPLGFDRFQPICRRKKKKRTRDDQARMKGVKKGDSAQRACHSQYILYSAARLRRAGPTVRIHRENVIRKGRRIAAAAHSRDVGGTDRRGRSGGSKNRKGRFRTRRCGENKISQTNCLATNYPLD